MLGTVTERATYRQVFAEPVFRVVFLTRSLAIGADTLRMIALSVLVFTATGSALLGAVAFGISFAPQVIGGLLLGALPDRMRPRPLIVFGYVAEAVGAAALALAPLPVWASLSVVAVIASMSPVFNGTAGRLTADVLHGEAFVLGRSMFQLAMSAAQVLGLAGGGVAVAALGPEAALLVASGCHLVAALGARLFLPDLPAAAAPGRSLVAQSLRGNLALLADQRIRLLLLVSWLPPVFVTAAESLLVPYGAERGWAAGAPGMVLACVPVGMIIGNLVVGRLITPDARQRVTGPLVVLLGAPLVVLAVDTGTVLAGVLLAVTGCGFAYGLCIQRAFRDAVPHDARGQAFGLMSTGLMTLQGVGPLAWGVLTEFVPVSLAVVLGGGVTILTGLWITTKHAQLRIEAPVSAGASMVNPPNDQARAL